MKILITGTHFTPAQALIEQLNKLGGQEIVYVGRKSTREDDKTRSIESRVLPVLGVRFVPIVSGRLSRHLSIWTVISLLKLPIGFLQSFWVVLKEQPNVIVSFGGYLAFPVVFWGWWFSVPVVIHEQTLRLGLANWLSKPFASKVALAFPIQSLKGDPRVEVIGNPVRQAMLGAAKGSKETEFFLKINQRLPKIVVLGGNQGSHFINRLIGKNLTELTKSYALIHQTGDSKLNDFDYLIEGKSKLSHPERYLLSKWFESQELSRVLQEADLVITRGGMNTLYELALRNKPALIIPIPTTVQTEQTQNAKFFVKAGLGEYMSQGEISDQVLLQRLVSIMKQLDHYQSSAESKQIFPADGASKLAQLVLGMKFIAR